jgi:hypothetical protein
LNQSAADLGIPRFKQNQKDSSERNTEILPNGGKRRPGRGDGEFDRFCLSIQKADRDCNIELPASPYAIMRRVHPYRGENSATMIVGELDTQIRNLKTLLAQSGALALG